MVLDGIVKVEAHLEMFAAESEIAPVDGGQPHRETRFDQLLGRAAPAGNLEQPARPLVGFVEIGAHQPVDP